MDMNVDMNVDMNMKTPTPGTITITSTTSIVSRKISATPLPPPSTESNNSPTALNMMYISPYTIFLAIIVAVLVFTRIIQICQIRRIRRRQQREAEARWNEILNGSNLLYNGVTINLPRGGGSVPISLNTDDRIKLYKRTFEQRSLNHTLVEQDFKPDAHEVETNEDNQNNYNSNSNKNTHDVESAYDQDLYFDDEEAPSIYLDLNKETNTPIKTENDEHDHQQHQSPATDTLANEEDVNKKNKNINTLTTNLTSRTKIPGTCIICFEHFQVGDIVVKSKNTDACQHVFHEDCMARYLASNSERTKPNPHLEDDNSNLTSYSDNPCPTCRQPYCTVSKEDIVLSVLLKSMRVAILQNQQNNQTNQENANDTEEGDVENPPSATNLSVIPEESSQDLESSDVILRILNPDD